MGQGLYETLSSYDCQATEGDDEFCLWLMQFSGRFFSNRLESYHYIKTFAKDYLLIQPDHLETIQDKSILLHIET